MPTLYASPIDTAYRRTITPSRSGKGSRVHSWRSFETAMDSVAALLANPRARLFSPRTVNVLRQQISYTEGTVNTMDARSSLIDTWAALLAVAEAPAGDQELAAQQRLVVVLAEMLCNPLQMPPGHRQCYWKLLQAFLLMLGRNPDAEEALIRIDPWFPERMDVLHEAVRHGRIQPVTAEDSDCQRRLRAADDLDLVRYLSPSTSHVIYDEAQYFGNSSDHWRRHTSHR